MTLVPLIHATMPIPLHAVAAILALVLTGLFTFAPGRIMNQVVTGV